jgi:Domain of Unknown Function (DUF928)
MLSHIWLKIGLIFLVVGEMQLPVVANLSDSLPLQWDFTPPDNGQPERREGAATRGPCLNSSQKLIALVPPSGQGLTIQAHPTFFWYLPENSAQKLKFTIRDQQKVIVYALEYVIPQTLKPQIMSLTLPSFVDNQSLKIGQEYDLRLDVFCQFNDDVPITFVENTIKRVAPNSTLPPNMNNISLLSQMGIYAEAGLWYDTLLSLVKLRNLYPNVPEFDLAWIKLLNSINLEGIAQDSLNAELNLN